MNAAPTTAGAALMTPDQIINDVETVAGELTRLRTEMDQVVNRLVGRLADSELQLEDVRAERDEEHRHAETLAAALADSERLAASLKSTIDNLAAIEEAAGIIAGKTGMGIPESKAHLRSYARNRRETIAAVADRLIAAQGPPASRPGDPEVGRIIATVGVPADFWNKLTLDGAIFE